MALPDTYPGTEVTMLANEGADPVVTEHPAEAPRHRRLAPGEFRYLDSTRGRLADMGLEPMHIAATAMFADGDNSQPDEAATRALARAAMASGRILLINIEHWRTDATRETPATVQRSIQNFSQLFTWLRDEEPALKFGVYAMFPNREYGTVTRYQTMESAQWTHPWWQGSVPTITHRYAELQAANDLLASIAQQVDYIFPSLYTFYSDQAGWVDYARHNIAEAQRYGKPVYAYLWPRFHQSAPGGIGYTQIPADFMRLQLETVREYADGLVIFEEFAHTWPADAVFLDVLREFVASDVTAPGTASGPSLTMPAAQDSTSEPSGEEDADQSLRPSDDFFGNTVARSAAGRDIDFRFTLLESADERSGDRVARLVDYAALR